MKKSVTIAVKVTKEQNELVALKARTAGYGSKAEFIRSLLFMERSTQDKINEIYNIIVGENK